MSCEGCVCKRPRALRRGTHNALSLRMKGRRSACVASRLTQQGSGRTPLTLQATPLPELSQAYCLAVTFASLAARCQPRRSLLPLLRKFVDGYNVCVVAFGATGQSLSRHRQSRSAKTLCRRVPHAPFSARVARAGGLCGQEHEGVVPISPLRASPPRQRQDAPAGGLPRQGALLLRGAEAHTNRSSTRNDSRITSHT